MDKFDRARKIISEAVSSNPVIDAAKEREKQSKEKQQKLKLKLAQRQDKLQDRKDEKKYNQSDSIVRKGIADKVRKSKFSKASTTKVSDKGETGITAVQQTAGKLIKTGVAAAKNVAKGVAKTTVGARDFKKKLDDRQSQRMDGNLERKISKGESKMRKEKIKGMKLKKQRKALEDRVIKIEKEKEKTKNKFSPPSVTKKPEQNRKQISGGAERKALPPAKPKQFGKDPDGSPSVGALARRNKSIRRKLIQQREEFIHEVEDKERKADEKLDRVIDIMRGKNKVKVNPDVKENKEVQGGISIQDYDPNMKFREYEFIDLIKPEPLKK